MMHSSINVKFKSNQLGGTDMIPWDSAQSTMLITQLQ
jgi:hypothetical protein